MPQITKPIDELDTKTMRHAYYAAVSVRARRGVSVPLAFPYVNRFSMAFLYGCAGRLTAKMAVSGPGSPTPARYIALRSS